MTEFNEDTSLRLEALRLANQVAHQHNKEALDLAGGYYKFLTGNDATLTPVQIADAWPDNIKDNRGVSAAAHDERPVIEGLPWSEAVEQHQEVQRKAQRRARGQQRAAREEVREQFMDAIHRAGIFVDPVLLTEKLTEAINEARIFGE